MVLSSSSLSSSLTSFLLRSFFELLGHVALLFTMILFSIDSSSIVPSLDMVFSTMHLLDIDSYSIVHLTGIAHSSLKYLFLISLVPLPFHLLMFSPLGPLPSPYLIKSPFLSPSPIYKGFTLLCCHYGDS